MLGSGLIGLARVFRPGRQLTGLLHGAPLLKHVDFPTAEVLGPDASEDQIQDLIRRHGQVFVKPLFKAKPYSNALVPSLFFASIQ